MSKIIENIYGQKYRAHSCRFPDETYQYIHKMSQRRKISFNNMLNEYLSTHQNIGRIFDKLQDLGLYDDATIIFTTDNGGNIGTYGSSLYFL